LKDFIGNSGNGRKRFSKGGIHPEKELFLLKKTIKELSLPRGNASFEKPLE
jgi:hypothetical protein